MNHDERVSYFFSQARRYVRLARSCSGPIRRDVLQLAMSWRELAKQTRQIRRRGTNLSVSKG